MEGKKWNFICIINKRMISIIICTYNRSEILNEVIGHIINKVTDSDPKSSMEGNLCKLLTSKFDKNGNPQ